MQQLTNKVAFKNDIRLLTIESYGIECVLSDSLTPAFKSTQKWHEACQMADRLNDLIEMYHAPCDNRSERRTIYRKFFSLHRRFVKHCQINHIDFLFYNDKVE
jgi:hypothetical protein